MNSKIVRDRNRAYISMMIPALIVMAVIFVFPIGKLLVNSFQKYKLIDPNGIKFIGLTNYINAFKDENFIASIGVTLKYTFYSLLIEVPLALILMEIISTVKKGSNLFKTLFLPPMIMPSVVTGTIWRLMFNPSFGVLPYFLSFLGINASGWLTSNDMSLFCLVLVDVWASTPFLLIILLSGRAAISEDLYEAACIDGASKISSFFKISLPLMKNTIMFGLMLRLTDCIRVFPTVHIMTGGGPGTATMTLNYLVYKQGFAWSNIGYASAMGIIQLIISVALVLVLQGSFTLGKGKKV